ncbi:MAG TPA: hypothetical protein VK176_04495 [Phycisphaerales bacterium]|nr:hypothetical protein [Phycisphaerales bacterium]
MDGIIAISPVAMQAWLNQQLGQNIARLDEQLAPPLPSIEKQMETIRAMAAQSQSKFKDLQIAGGAIDVTI